MPGEGLGSMTGPTSVARSAGSPATSSRRALDHLDHAVGDAFVQAQQAQRGAALAGGAERALHHGVATCSGSAVLSTTMALMPPVSAISGTIGPSLAASARLMSAPPAWSR
jgi:hypothetical protein